MRLVVTGGGTGGHVFPALEVARHAVEEGAEVCYFGSLRGIESRECKKAGIPFRGFRSSPLQRPFTPSGIRSALGILRSSAGARKALREFQPALIFSTGGYAAAPILAAARTLGIPIILHEQNTVPGRTNVVLSKFARVACLVFEQAATYFECETTVTGMPIRRELVEAAGREPGERFLTVALGGSQGSAALNEAFLTLAMQVGTDQEEWLQVTGPSNFETCATALARVAAPPNFRQKPFLEAAELAEVLRRADLVISRAGTGMLCELALFGIPSVLIPYPHAFANHQYENAKVIEAMGGAIVLPQSQLTPENLAAAWRQWRDDEGKRAAARAALQSWVIRDATDRIWHIIRANAR
ncbi:MAG: undecaprenyldiphospho-muramoylpentapeptide beta-N-acetylglucosaminyltransferase [Armatimonadetes bacterium]|nr:MAG: undecaprenyldiphospho-muramoylpentapeptide beta-N-acetylglucosaminyltransferase [Armatimonadota bacterium]